MGEREFCEKRRATHIAHGLPHSSRPLHPAHMPNQIFISHAEEDAARAHAVVRALEERGARCWIAPRDITPGVNWGGAISQAIATSRLMILFVSRHANASQHVLREVERAVSRRVPIVPLRLEHLELSPDLDFYLGAPHWLDASRLTDDELLEPLVRSIRSLAPDLVSPDANGLARRADEGTRTAPEEPSPPGRRTRLHPREWPMIAVWTLAGGLALYGIGQALEGRKDDRSVAPAPDSSAVRDRVRPLRIGSGIGTSGSRFTVGSFGAFAVDARGTRYLITTINVLGKGVAAGTPVLQPRPADGGQLPGDRIGTVATFVPTTDTMDTSEMVALVRLDDSIRVDPAIPGIGRISGIRTVDAWLPGTAARTLAPSGVGRGVIQAINYNFNFIGTSSAARRPLRVTGAIRAALPFSRCEGGALVVDDDNRAVGVVIYCGGRGDQAVLAPIKAALDRLGVTLLTDENLPDG
ncbi:MAG TPA: TIR domain-containing protein [Longimicrobium sp.]|nr:TIR domain-containing protein [Longimicrobium sp.]